ncbi:DUF4058 family protein [Alienimonas sp. DA493]|uniref:DUF4058 family protein n=1 Tax=Alienimonas sp. DA493 TaxID=3373605 RepID=UPI0037547B56
MAEPPATVDDWTRVDAGTFHDFHQTWIPQLKLALNGGLLPPGYYGHVERSFGTVSAAEHEADLLTLEEGAAVFGGEGERDGGTAVLDAPPRVAEVTDLAHVSESEYYAARASRLAIRREVDHRVVALLELASPGNKDRPASVERFVSKLTEAMEDGVHVVLIDLLPGGRSDPAGLHGAVLEALGRDYEAPAGKPLCAAGYQVGPRWRSYAEPLAVGDPLPTVPLFLTPDRYVPVPLGPSYGIARGGIGHFWEEVLDGVRDAPGRG